MRPAMPMRFSGPARCASPEMSPVEAGLVTVEKRQHVAQFALLELHVERCRTVALEPLAAQHEAAETARRAVRARRLGVHPQRPGSLR